MMLGGARRVSMAQLLKESGQRMGLEVSIISYELMEQVPISLEAKVIVGLRWSDPKVVADIVRVARQHEVSVILPFVDGAIEIASKCRPHLPEVFIPVSDFELCRRMFDKTEAAKAFEEKQIPIPQTYGVVNAEMPAIAKPRHGSASRGIKIFHNIDDLMQLTDIHDYLIQEYIEDKEEYTVDCYVDRQGETLTVVPRCRLEVMGGEVTRTITCRNAELDRMSRHILKAFDFRGPVTLQFLHDLSSDRYLLMEINPRLGGGVVCSIYAGAPFCDYILGESLGEKQKPCTNWSYNTLMARYQKEAIFYEA